MDPLPNHMVKEKDDSTIRLIKGKEFLQMTKEEDFQGYALVAKLRDEVKAKKPLPMEVEELLKQYPSIVA